MTEPHESLDRKCRFCASSVATTSMFCATCGASIEGVLADEPLLNQLNALFAGELRIGDELGRGGTAAVFRAYDPGLERYVAVKTLLPDLAEDPDMSARFQREARTVAALRHPNVVTVFGVRSNAEVSAIVMQFVDGRALDAALNEDEPMALPVAGLILAQVALGLQHAHDRGIVHRDMKPGNVLLAKDGLAVVSDFGIARREGGERLTASGIMMGTVAYMSPEQIVGSAVGPSSDRYSFGIMAFELLAGRRPFSGTRARILAAHHTQEPPQLSALRPDLPTAVTEYVHHLMAKDPEARPSSLRDAQRVFLSLVPDPVSAATQIVSISHARAAARRSAARSAVVAIPVIDRSTLTTTVPETARPGAASQSDTTSPATVNRAGERRISRFLIAAAVTVVVGVGGTIAVRTMAPKPDAATAALPVLPQAAPRDTTLYVKRVTPSQGSKPVEQRQPESSPRSTVAAHRQDSANVTAHRDSEPVSTTIAGETKPAVSGERPPASTGSASTAVPTVTSGAGAAPPAVSATLADARAVANQFVTLCNQRRWRELDALGSFGGDASLRAELIRLVRTAADFAAGFDRLASTPAISNDGFMTEFAVDLEWRGNKRVMTVRVLAEKHQGGWQAASFGISAP